MDYKEIIYQQEEQFLSPFAQKSNQSKGRVFEIEPCPVRTDYARDRDRIIHSKAFRRLKHKTQVFLSPEGDHYRTRLTHTLEVSQIARSIARGLRLNEDLTEAIALAHDLGHTPYGHAGERALNEFTPFKHNEQSLRVADVLENGGKGMNLTYEVRDGILNHRLGLNPSTLEGKVVALSDKIAYINHDIDDAIRAEIIKQSDIPQHLIKELGATHGERINCMILDIIKVSQNSPVVKPTEKMYGLISELRAFLFEKVYFTSAAKAEEGKAIEMIKYLYRYFLTNLNEIPADILSLNSSNEQKVCDYISMFSDNYAVMIFQKITIPKNWGY